MKWYIKTNNAVGLHIPRNMLTVRALLCFVVVWWPTFLRNASRVLGNDGIAPEEKQYIQSNMGNVPHELNMKHKIFIMFNMKLVFSKYSTHLPSVRFGLFLSLLLLLLLLSSLYHHYSFVFLFKSASQCLTLLVLGEINHYDDVIMGAMASQITSLTIVYSTVYSDADQRKHQSSASLAFVQGIHRGPVNSQHEWPVTRKMFPFDDVIMSRPWWLLMQSFVCQAIRSHGNK